MSSLTRARVVHNIAKGPNVDIYLDGSPALVNVAYKAISDYMNVPPGKHLISIKAANTMNSIKDVYITFQQGQAYTIIAEGLISDPASIGVMALQDYLMCPPTGYANLRFIHAAAGAPAVDIYAGTTKVFSNVSYGTTGRNGMHEYLSVPAGPVNISVTPAGSMTNVLTVNATLDSGGVYTVIASGIVGDAATPLAALVSEDTNGACFVRQW